MQSNIFSQGLQSHHVSAIQQHTYEQTEIRVQAQAGESADHAHPDQDIGMARDVVTETHMTVGTSASAAVQH